MHKTIEKEASFELIEKKSRFIGQVCPVDNEDDALAFLEKIRSENTQARHNVYAYKLISGRTRYSDDGEPAQTAGMPTLDVLDHAELMNVICVTTRYFGGTLLGTGGLVRAYTQAAQGAIEAAGIVVISDCRDLTVVIEYSLYDQLQRFASSKGVKVVKTDYSDKVRVIFRLKADDVEEFLAGIQELTNARCDISLSETFSAAI